MVAVGGEGSYKISQVRVNNTDYTFGGKVLDSDYYSLTQTTVLISDSSLSATSATTISLASYLPTGYDYEICLSCESNVKTSGKWGKLAIVSGTKTYANISDSDTINVSEVTARTSANYYNQGTVWIPIKSTDRNITLYNNGTSSVTNIRIDLKGYRIIGTNGKTVSNPISTISTGGATYAIAGDIADGGWTFKYQILAQSVTLSSYSSISYSLADYLPNDTYDYMVLLSGWGRTGTSSGNNCELVIDSYNHDSSLNIFFFMQAGYHSESSYICASNIMIPVIYSTNSYINRKVSWSHTQDSGTTGACGLYAVAYRRIGTNNYTV